MSVELFKAPIRRTDPFSIPAGQHVDIPPAWSSCGEMVRDVAMDIVRSEPDCMFHVRSKAGRWRSYAGGNPKALSWGKDTDPLGCWDRNIKGYWRFNAIQAYLSHPLLVLTASRVARKLVTPNHPAYETMQPVFDAADAWAYCPTQRTKATLERAYHQYERTRPSMESLDVMLGYFPLHLRSLVRDRIAVAGFLVAFYDVGNYKTFPWDGNVISPPCGKVIRALIPTDLVCTLLNSRTRP